ncbi:TonB-dependent receptor family protein [Salinicola endophyticus]|uniref:TonB-dependent receptor family protein n=1 Tax=Salinicola endophyticus TaxID=1949083 RepID=UPI000DA26347
MTIRILSPALGAGVLLAPLSALAQAGSTAPMAQPVIEVTAPRLARELYATPAAVSVVDREAIQQGQQRVRLDESLDLVPGLYLQNRNNFAQGQRIAIRGFGARAPFGVRGITVMVDGIPYTLPDGQAQLDAIDLDSAERIEVIRGPAAVQYGNAAGGVISVTTANGRDDPGSHIRMEGGSHGYRKFAVSNGGVNGPWSHHVSLSALDYSGYRDHSATEKYLLNAKLRRELGSDRALTAIVNLLDNPESEDPGGLTRAQVHADRDQAGAFTEKYDTGQNVDQQVFGLQYEDLSAGPGALYLKGFYLRRDFEQQLPYPGDSLIDYQRDYYGGSAEYHQTVHLGQMPLRYVAGVDIARQRDDRGRKNVAFSGAVTGTAADETQTATSLGTFVQGDLDLDERWTLSLGGRYDRVRMKIDDAYIDSANGDGDDSGERTFDQWSGSAGISYRYRANHQLYANTGTAYETPTFSEFANPSGAGGFNGDIEPQKAWNRELGLRGSFANGFDYDVALFSVRVRDELVPYEGESGRTFYQNAGDSERDGLEVALGWQFTPSWRLDSALTLARYHFDHFSDTQGRYDGKRIPGLPQQTWVNRLSWEGLGERFASIETQYVGDMVADNAGEVTVGDYWLVNLRGGDGWHLGGDTWLKTYVGIRNLFAVEHYANVRINASNARYFEPAPGRTVYAGIGLDF